MSHTNGCTRGLIYARFSPQPEKKAAAKTCEEQTAICRRFCEASGLDVAGVYSDPLASRADDYERRPRLWQAIQAIRKGTALVAYRRDRIGSGRMAYLIDHDVRKKGGQILTVEGGSNEDTIEARLMNDILALLDEYERHRTAARTQAIMLAAQSSGRKMSRHPPYGWGMDPTDSSRWVEDEREQAAVLRAVDLARQGMTTYGIAKRLGAEGFRSRRPDGQWWTKTVRAILIREGALDRTKRIGA